MNRNKLISHCTRSYGFSWLVASKSRNTYYYFPLDKTIKTQIVPLVPTKTYVKPNINVTRAIARFLKSLSIHRDLSSMPKTSIKISSVVKSVRVVLSRSLVSKVVAVLVFTPFTYLGIENKKAFIIKIVILAFTHSFILDQKKMKVLRNYYTHM